MNELNEKITDVYNFENYITKQYMKLFSSHQGIYKVRGGGYIRKKVNINNIDFGKTVRPNCDCGHPADVFKSKNNDIYYVCPARNNTWLI
jgi:hypothetical protein